MLHIKARANGRGRERTLTPAELREVWLATEAADDNGKRLVTDDYARIIKLLILTGQRRVEIGGLSWLEIFEGSNPKDSRIERRGPAPRTICRTSSPLAARR